MCTVCIIFKHIELAKYSKTAKLMYPFRGCKSSSDFDRQMACEAPICWSKYTTYLSNCFNFVRLLIIFIMLMLGTQKFGTQRKIFCCILSYFKNMLLLKNTIRISKHCSDSCFHISYLKYLLIIKKHILFNN